MKACMLILQQSSRNLRWQTRENWTYWNDFCSNHIFTSFCFIETIQNLPSLLSKSLFDLVVAKADNCQTWGHHYNPSTKLLVCCVEVWVTEDKQLFIIKYIHKTAAHPFKLCAKQCTYWILVWSINVAMNNEHVSYFE